MNDYYFRYSKTSNPKIHNSYFKEQNYKIHHIHKDSFYLSVKGAHHNFS